MRAAASSLSAHRLEVVAGGGGGEVEYVRPYHILLLSDIYNRIHNLYSLQPHLCNLTLAQELYGLPTVHSSDKDYSQNHIDGFNKARGRGWDQDVNGNGYIKEECKNWILTTRDKIAHTRCGTIATVR